MPDEAIERLRREVTDLTTAVAAQTVRLEQYANREWVNDKLGPLGQSMNDLRQSVASLSTSQQHLTARVENLFDAHEKLLQERSEREREMHIEQMAALKDQGFWMIVTKKWQPLLALIVAVVIIAGAGIKVLEVVYQQNAKTSANSR